jgi:hypothetical protein
VFLRKPYVSNITRSLVILLAALCVSAIAFARGGAEVTRLASKPNAMTALYYPGSYDVDYSAEATMNLGRTGPHGGYDCVWLMFVDYSHPSKLDKPPFHEPPFVQAGLMRGWQRSQSLTAFVTMSGGGGDSGAYLDVGNLAEGSHRVLLRGDRRQIQFFVDGHLVYAFHRSTFFAERTKMELAIGSELSHPGDIASASVRSVLVKRDTDNVLLALSPSSMYAIGGVKFVAAGTSYFSNRVFDPTVVASWERLRK